MCATADANSGSSSGQQQRMSTWLARMTCDRDATTRSMAYGVLAAVAKLPLCSAVLCSNISADSDSLGGQSHYHDNMSVR
jgi:hypothetical protein